MDRHLFFLINQAWTHPALDMIMAAASAFDVWLPFLAMLAGLTAWRGGRRARTCLLALGLMVLVGDALVSNTLKHALHRPRPWQAQAGVRQVDLAHGAKPRLLALFQPVRVTFSPAPEPVDRGGGRSFPSSHTVNNFCAATVLAWFYRRWGWLYFLPAALVAYSRMYVGAHWPSDVFLSASLAMWLTLGVMLALERLQSKMTNDRSREVRGSVPG